MRLNFYELVIAFEFELELLFPRRDQLCMAANPLIPRRSFSMPSGRSMMLSSRLLLRRRAAAGVGSLLRQNRTVVTAVDPRYLRSLDSRTKTSTSCVATTRTVSCGTSSSPHSGGLHCRAFSDGAAASISEQDDNDPQHQQLQHYSDFFEEPVTFLGGNDRTTGDPALAMAALDTHIVSVVSKGKSADGGADEEGIPTKSAHSYAISWVELLERAMQWNDGSAKRASQGSADASISTAAPMLVVAAVAPLLAQAGSEYVANVDCILSSATVAASPRNPTIIQMMPMAHYAASFKDSDDDTLSPREQHHLRALHHLLDDDHRQALECYQKILQLCPGDALALSLALDVSSTLSDGAAALRAATAVASYWNERGRRGLPGVTNAVQPGHSIGTALIAVGYAAGGRYVEAERLAEEALTRDDAGAGGVAVWALAAAYTMPRVGRQRVHRCSVGMMGRSITRDVVICSMNLDWVGMEPDLPWTETRQVPDEVPDECTNLLFSGSYNTTLSLTPSLQQDWPRGTNGA